MSFHRYSCAIGLLAATVLLLAPPEPALAHHSFAMFFNSDQDVMSIKGTVKVYHFTNPHGIIDLVVPKAGGGEEHWRVETNSPSILLYRGWTKNSLSVGEVVTIQGWRARDGSNYMRMRSAFRENGAKIGNSGTVNGGNP